MALIRAISGSGGGSGNGGLLLYYGRGAQIGDAVLYKDTDYSSYATDTYASSKRTFTFLKHVKGVVYSGAYAGPTSGTASLTSLVNDAGGPSFVDEFEANVNDTLIVNNAYSASAMCCMIFIEEEL